MEAFSSNPLLGFGTDETLWKLIDTVVQYSHDFYQYRGDYKAFFLHCITCLNIKLFNNHTEINLESIFISFKKTKES